MNLLLRDHGGTHERDIAQTPVTDVAGPLPTAGSITRRLSIAVVGLSLSSFFALAYAVCFIVELLLPDPAVQAWLKLFPGTLSVNWFGLIQGLVLSVFWGWFIGLVFVPIHNFYSARLG
jgi:hypothetical protein